MRCGLTDEIEIDQQRGSALVQSFLSQIAGEVRFAKGSLLLDHDGDGRAELEILLTGVKRFSGGSLVL